MTKKKRISKLSTRKLVILFIITIMCYFVLLYLGTEYLQGIRLDKFVIRSGHINLVLNSSFILFLIVCFRDRITSLNIFGADLKLDLNEIKLDIEIFKETIYPILLFELEKVEHDGLIEGNFGINELDDFLLNSEQLYDKFYSDDNTLKRYLICGKAKLLDKMFLKLKELIITQNAKLKLSSLDDNEEITSDRYYKMAFPRDMSIEIEIETSLRPIFEKNLNCGLTRQKNLFSFSQIKINFKELKSDLDELNLKYDSNTLDWMEYIEQYYYENKRLFTSFPELTN